MNRLLLPWIAVISLTSHSLITVANKVDPTQPLSYSTNQSANSSGGLSLESILYSDARKVVVINQQVLSEGDKLGNVKVTRINPTNVRVTENGKSKTLVLPETDVKKPSTNN